MGTKQCVKMLRMFEKQLKNLVIITFTALSRAQIKLSACLLSKFLTSEAFEQFFQDLLLKKNQCNSKHLGN